MKLKLPPKLSDTLHNHYTSATPLKRRMFVMIGSVLTVFLLIFAIKMIGMIIMMAAMKNTPHTVSVSAMPAKYDRWQPKLKASASLTAVRGVDITTELAGIVHVIHARPGADVKQGDLILELIADSEIAQLHSLEAQAELAKTNYLRNKAQYVIHAISKAALDASEATLKSQDALVVQQAAIVNKKFIRAPFTGRLGIIPINVGQYLNPGDPIVTLQTLDPMYVDFYVPQQNLTHLRIGQPVKVTTDTYPGKVFNGAVTTITPKIDPSTRNVQVQATVSNPLMQLYPGMFASVEINVGAPEFYLTLPQTAISYNSYGDIVFLVKSSEDKKGKTTLTVKQTFVTVGPVRGDQVAVLKGIKSGDLIVVAGQMKLKNNDEVLINNTVLPSNDPAPHPVNK
jgi:membrane fusion protein, multidrug efflux system